jgi:hypothetical protein
LDKLFEKPVKSPVFLLSKEAVPKTEVLEQPHLTHKSCVTLKNLPQRSIAKHTQRPQSHRFSLPSFAYSLRPLRFFSVLPPGCSAVSSLRKVNTDALAYPLFPLDLFDKKA